MRALLVGEALMRLRATAPAADPAAALYAPTPGGPGLEVALAAAARGARVALAGGVGDDGWGRALRDRLDEAGVELDHLLTVRGLRTTLVVADAEGSEVDVRGAGAGPGLVALGERLLDAVDESDALCFSSRTLVGRGERELTLAARDRALESELPVVFVPALAPARWSQPARAATEAREGVRGAFLVLLDAREGRLLTGEEDAEAAAEALVAGGARHAVVATAEGGAVLRGGGFVLEAEPGPGALTGDALAGALLAALTRSGFYPPVLGTALRTAVAGR